MRELSTVLRLKFEERLCQVRISVDERQPCHERTVLNLFIQLLLPKKHEPAHTQHFVRRVAEKSTIL